MPRLSARILAMLIVTLSSVNTFAIEPLTLKEAFNAAVQKTETLPIQSARTRQLDQRIKQSVGAVLPKLSFEWTYLRQDTQDLRARTNTATSSFSLPEQTVSRLSATQHLFQGFREFEGLRSLRSQLQAQRFVEQNTELILFSNVAQAFYNVLSSEKDLDNLKKLIEIAERRVTQLSNFARLGRSRRSDLLGARSQLANLRAQAASSESALNNARERFAFLTGLAPDTKLIDGPEQIPETLEPAQTYVDAVEGRPDIKSLLELERAAEANVKVAKGAYWPTLDLDGNYYFHRTGILEGSHWDVGLTLSFSIFEGGSLVANTRETQEALTEQRLVLAQARRSAQEEILSLYKLLAGGIEQLRLYNDALVLAEDTYRQVNHDFEVGAVTNLEVLQALNALASARRSVDQVRFQSLIYMNQLAAAQGKIN